MPRKKNGLGSFSPAPVRGANSKTNVSGVKKAAGSYPSNRRYGTLALRTVIESYDLNSRWVRWRKGYEYFSKAFYTGFQTLVTKMYQGQADSWEVEFTGYKFPTYNADSATHYVARKTIMPGQTPNLGTITGIDNDANTDSANKAEREIWLDVDSPNRILNRMLLDRISDGENEATIKYVLNSHRYPAVYLAKPISGDMPEAWKPLYGEDTGSILFVNVPLTTVVGTQFMIENDNNIQAYVGLTGYLPVPMEANKLSDITEDADNIYTHMVHTPINQKFQILDSEGALPDAIYNISLLDKLLDTDVNTAVGVDVLMEFPKEPYQRFFGSQYMDALTALSQVDTIFYAVPPWTVKSVGYRYRWELQPGGSFELVWYVQFEAAPFKNEVYYEATKSPRFDSCTLLLTDYSFTKRTPLPQDPYVPKGFSSALNTDVDPWMDETFTAGGNLKPAEMYTCSCPDYAKAQLRMPGGQKQGGKKRNRQERYPLPSALSRQDVESVGLNSVAGITQGWGTYKDRSDFHFCKHTAAAMFIDGIKLKEPSDYPSLDSREKFDVAMEEEFDKLDEAFDIQVRRSEITTTEIVFALAQGLNLDEIEMANLLLETKF